MPNYDEIYKQRMDHMRQVEAERVFKEQYTRRQKITERAMAEAIDGDGAEAADDRDPGSPLALLVFVAAMCVVYAVLAAIVTIAIVGGGIAVGAIVLGLLGVPGLKLAEASRPGGRRSSLPRAYLTMVLAFVAFGLAVALAHLALYLLLDLRGGILLPAIPALAPLAAVVAAVWYFVTNSVAPDALVAALTPTATATTVAILACAGFVGGALLLRHRDRVRFGGRGGWFRALLVIAVPLVIGAGGLIGLGYVLAHAGF